VLNPLSESISHASVRRVRELIGPHIRRTPLLRAKAPGPLNIHLKCENLQVTNSFKVRGALGALHAYRRFRPEVWSRIVRDGVVTGSSGNFAQGLAHVTSELDLAYTVVVPDSIPEAKRSQILAFNPRTRIVPVPYQAWRRTMVTSSFPGQQGFFLSSESDPYVSLGIATMGREIQEDLPQVDAVLVPYGGGNLAYSLATYLDLPVYAVEISTGAPLSASLQAGHPTEVPYERSFVDGIGASFVIPAQFERLKDKLAGVFTVTPQEIAGALSSLAFSDKIVCEGAGAAAYAAALKHSSSHGWRNPVAVVSGGVIDPDVLLHTLTSTGQPAGTSVQ
jgi:threonine dehydratase